MHSLLKERKSFGETRCRESWAQFKEFDSPSPRYVTRVSRTKQDHRLEKYESNLDISEVPTKENSRIGPTKRLKDKSDVPKTRLGILPKIKHVYMYVYKYMYIQAQSERPGYTLVACRKVGSPKCLSKRARGERVCGWFPCEYAFGGQWERPQTLLSWRSWGHQGVRRRWWRPTARCEQKKKPRYMCNNWTCSSLLCFFKKLPPVLSLGKLCGEHGYTYHWKSGQNPHLIRNGKRNDCNVSNSVYRLWFLEYQRVLPQLRLHLPRHHLHHWSRHRLTEIQYQKTEVWSCSIPQKLKTKIKIGHRKKYKEIYRMNCLIGYRNTGRIWLMKVLQKSFGETWCREVQTLPVRLMNFQWSREHTWNPVRVSTV